jgi:hypothetical protein
MAIRNGSVKQLQKTIPKLNQIVKSNLILKQKKSSFLLDFFIVMYLKSFIDFQE